MADWLRGLQGRAPAAIRFDGEPPDQIEHFAGLVDAGSSLCVPGERRATRRLRRCGQPSDRRGKLPLADLGGADVRRFGTGIATWRAADNSPERCVKGVLGFISKRVGDRAEWD